MEGGDMRHFVRKPQPALPEGYELVPPTLWELTEPEPPAPVPPAPEPDLKN